MTASRGGHPGSTEFFTNDVIEGLLKSSLDTAQLGADGFTDVGESPGSDAGDIDFLTIADSARSVTEDVERIRNHPLVPGRLPISGYLYDVRSGHLVEVPEATVAGAAV